MSKKSGFGVRGLVLLGLGLLLLSSRFRSRFSSPENQIRKVFESSKYRGLTDYVIAQAKHETANFTSNIFKNANNAFGMGVPSIRPFDRQGVFTAQDGTKYSSYSSPSQSARDYILYLDNFNFPVSFTSPELFVLRLQSQGYFTDSYSNYLNGLKRWL